MGRRYTELFKECYQSSEHEKKKRESDKPKEIIIIQDIIMLSDSVILKTSLVFVLLNAKGSYGRCALLYINKTRLYFSSLRPLPLPQKK